MKATEIFNSTRDADGRFKTGYRATVGSRYVTVELLTNRQGYSDKRWRVPLRRFDAMPGDTVADKIFYVSQNTEPCWVGKPIQ